MKVKFFGIDDWNRPVFKCIDKNIFLGSCEILFEYGARETEVLEKISGEHLCYFGSSFNCEPMGSVFKEIPEIVPNEYTVWVGGGEVNENLLTDKEAMELAKVWVEKGYDDVQVERIV